MVKLFILLLAVGALAQEEVHPSQETSSSEESSETSTVTSELSTTPAPPTEAEENKNIFINRVHSLASNISRNLVIHDNKVVYSPFALVNAISGINGDDDLLQNGFRSAHLYLEKENPLNATLISLGYTKNVDLLSRNISNLDLRPLQGDQDVNALLQAAFLNVTNFNQSSNATDASTERLNATETMLLTGLGVESLWATPFHPRYARKSRFFVNGTHVVKTKFMNNIGFYKYAELEEFDAVAVALPLKKSPRTYAIFIKPNNPENLEALNTKFEGVENFTDIFKQKFKTKRVQVSLPRVDIDSQFPINLSPTTSTLHISSLLISYTGLYNNFHHSPLSKPPRVKPIKFTRLRRRPDDAKLKLDSPFLFHLYDDAFAGFLLSGLILNPAEVLEVSPIPQISPEVKLAKEASSTKCWDEYQRVRKSSDIYDNLAVSCDTDNEEYKAIIRDNSLNFTFKSGKRMDKLFYRNEVESRNVSMGESVLRVKYGSFGEMFDGKIVRVVMENVSLHILYPNERSGLARIEEILEVTPLSKLNCQMREMSVRLKFPEVEGQGFGIRFEIVDKKKKTELVPIERERQGRKGGSNKRYRQLTIDRAFVYVITEHSTGGVVQIGRIITPGKEAVVV